MYFIFVIGNATSLNGKTLLLLQTGSTQQKIDYNVRNWLH